MSLNRRKSRKTQKTGPNPKGYPTECKNVSAAEESGGIEERSLQTVDIGVNKLEALLEEVTLDIARAPEGNLGAPVVFSDAKSGFCDSVAIERIDLKLEQLIEQSTRVERERLEIEDLRIKLQDAINAAEATNAEKNRYEAVEDSSCDAMSDFKLENEKLINLLATARNEYQALLEFIENDDVSKLTNSIRNDSKDREQELCVEIELLKEKVAILSETKDTGSVTGTDSDFEQQLNILREQLIESRHETVEVRSQYNELSIRLAQYQAPTSHSSESFSWEERKLAWLRQLEHETQVENNVSPSRVLEIEKVIEQTDQEVLRRDKEIADLKSLLQEQSVASNGMAVGAAAIAQIIEADDLIIEERQRLKQLQEDWEQKQRQGEIEMSLERAKLARERLELQERMRSLEAMHANQVMDEKGAPSPGKSKGNWLARLGLRDE
ncbi:MAG: hypothetical protein NTY42_00215 [Planctomycetota bacterium]|jgi:hypothetical protein|nr:hypothetical protein [Planctomycetota bacterium]